MLPIILFALLGSSAFCCTPTSGVSNATDSLKSYNQVNFKIHVGSPLGSAYTWGESGGQKENLTLLKDAFNNTISQALNSLFADLVEKDPKYDVNSVALSNLKLGDLEEKWKLVPACEGASTDSYEFIGDDIIGKCRDDTLDTSFKVEITGTFTAKSKDWHVTGDMWKTMGIALQGKLMSNSDPLRFTDIIEIIPVDE